MKKLFGEILDGRLFGHPIHMMLVHFPSALFPMSVVFDLASIYFEDNNLSLFSFYSAAAGITLGWFALIFGIIDLLKIESQPKAFSKALLHGGLNLTWLIIFSVFVGIDFKTYPQINFPNILEVVVKIWTVIGILFSNFLGGELVLRFNIGKKK